MDALNLTKDGGVSKVLLDAGEGESPLPGKKVFVTYIGKFEDGNVFDQSDESDPFVFNLNKGEVISGWDIAVSSMKKGERALFTIKSDYAYGSQGIPGSIPPSATLLFEIKLLKFYK